MKATDPEDLALAVGLVIGAGRGTCRQVSPRPPANRSGVSSAPNASKTARGVIIDELVPLMGQVCLRAEASWP